MVEVGEGDDKVEAEDGVGVEEEEGDKVEV